MLLNIHGEQPKNLPPPPHSSYIIYSKTTMSIDLDLKVITHGFNSLILCEKILTVHNTKTVFKLGIVN